jgi:hypothetical protein
VQHHPSLRDIKAAALVAALSMRMLAGHLGTVGDGIPFPAFVNLPPKREGE